MTIQTFYTDKELKGLGLKSYGRNIKISRNSIIYAPEKVTLGDNVRIDDFCILSGSIQFGSYIHIGAYTGLYGQAGLTFEDFSGTSARVLIYTTSNDYSGEGMTNPTVPARFKKDIDGPVTIHKHALLGAGTIVLPGVDIGEGTAVGAASLVSQDLLPWKLYVGAPARAVKERKKNLLELERQLWEEVRFSEKD